jgi:ABC-2 type transport system ATP-binding protein
MIETSQLSKRFGLHLAVDELTLSIAPGEIFCLLGANGAGKTTTIQMLLGLLTPTQGFARIGGFDCTRQGQAARALVAYIPEQVALYDQLTGIENLSYFASLSGGSTLDVRRSAELLVATGLPADALDRRVNTYSKGMRQKVGIALARAREARVLLLDEPTSGLDPEASNDFSCLIRSGAAQGLTTFMATHDLFRAKELGGRIGIMRKGRLAETLDATEISHRDLEQLYLSTVSAA